VSGRIRGHYRIDSSGRVQPLLDVNGAAKPYTLPSTRQTRRRSSVHSHMRQFIAGGIAICIALGSLLAMLPRIERLILTEQAKQIAMVRADYIQKHPALETLLKRR
jgi:hypothetical protein